MTNRLVLLDGPDADNARLEYGDEGSDVRMNGKTLFGGSVSASASNSSPVATPTSRVSRSLLDDIIVLKKGEDFVGCVDMRCEPSPRPSARSAALNASPAAGNGVSNKTSHGSQLCAAGELGYLYLEWRRSREELLTPPPTLRRGSGMTAVAGKYVPLSVGATSQVRIDASSSAHPATGTGISTDLLESEATGDADPDGDTQLISLSTAHSANVVAPISAGTYDWLPALGSPQIQLAEGSTSPIPALNTTVRCNEICTAKVPFPVMTLLESPFLIDVLVPSHATLGSQLALHIRITNKLSTLERIQMVMPVGTDENGNDGNAAESSVVVGVRPADTNLPFLITGPAKQSLVLAPQQTVCVSYTLIPVECGMVALPAATLTWKKTGAKILELAKLMYVQPEWRD